MSSVNGPGDPSHWAFESWLRLAIRVWALLGGLLLCAICLMTVVSVTSLATIGEQVPGDFEMTEIGIAICAFMFLPYAQITGANVTVDIFTSWASLAYVRVINVLASLIAFAFAALLLWRMWEGMFDLRRYGEETGIIGFPVWMGFPPMLVSLVFLALAGLVSAKDAYVTGEPAEPSPPPIGSE